MKYLIILLSFVTTTAFATTDPNVDAIKAAIGKGNVETLAKYFDKNIEVCIMEDEEIYGIEDATSKIRDFFSTYKSKNLHDVHLGKSKGKEAFYLIGNLTMISGEFRVYIYLRDKAGTPVIEEIRFDKA